MRGIVSDNIRMLVDAKGITEAALAKGAGIPNACLKHLLSGAMDESEWDQNWLYAIADVLKVPIYDLFRKPRTLETVRFRAKRTAKGRDWVLADAARRLDDALFLESLFADYPDTHDYCLEDGWSKPVKQADENTTPDQIVDASTVCRDVMSLGNMPVENPVELLRRFGIRLIMMDMPKG